MKKTSENSDKIMSLINYQDLNIDFNSYKSLFTDKIFINYISDKIDKVRINAIILVKNQEELIEDVILKTSEITDAVEVFDTGSSDNTLEIVKKIAMINRNIILHEIEWIENYGLMRNIALSQSLESEWVMFIDSDEYILTEISKYDFKIVLLILDYLLGDNHKVIKFKQMGADSLIPNWVVRVFKRSESLKFYGYVHEELRSDFRNIKKVRVNIEIENFGRTKEQILKFQKEKRYYELLKLNMKDEPDNITWPAYLPVEYSIRVSNDWYMSILKKFYNEIEDNTHRFTGIIEVFLLNYAKALIINKRFDEAITVVEYGSQLFPNNTSMIFFKYNILNLKIIKKSLKYIKSLKQDIDSIDFSNSEWETFNDSNSLLEIYKKLLLHAEMYEVVEKLG